jgi:hypothetical protein
MPKAVVWAQLGRVLALGLFAAVKGPIHVPVLQDALSGTCCAERLEAYVCQSSVGWLANLGGVGSCNSEKSSGRFVAAAAVVAAVLVLELLFNELCRKA